MSEVYWQVQESPKRAGSKDPEKAVHKRFTKLSKRSWDWPSGTAYVVFLLFEVYDQVLIKA